METGGKGERKKGRKGAGKTSPPRNKFLATSQRWSVACYYVVECLALYVSVKILFISLSLSLSVCLSVCLYGSLCVCLSVCLYGCLCVCLDVPSGCNVYILDLCYVVVIVRAVCYVETLCFIYCINSATYNSVLSSNEVDLLRYSA